MDQKKRTPMSSAADGGHGGSPENTRRKLRNDVIFIIALLLSVSAVGLGFFLLRGEGHTVTVEVDGKVIGIYSLREDQTVDIVTGENNSELNRLVIRDGEAFVESATCPDGICAAHRPISRKGESIVCLPHRVVITVVGSSEDTGPDVIA